jgi:cleavage stimulation factor subunit 2
VLLPAQPLLCHGKLLHYFILFYFSLETLQLQMPNIRQASGHPTQLPLRDSQQAQPLAVQTLPGLPPLAQNKMQSGLMPKVQESQASTVSQNPSVHNQFSSPLQPRIQLPQHANNHIVQQATVLGQSTVSTLPPVLPISLSSLSSRPQIQGANSSSLNHQVQPHMLQRSGQVGAANLGHSFQMANPNARTQSSVLPHPPLSDAGFQVPNFASVVEVSLLLLLFFFF